MLTLIFMTIMIYFLIIIICNVISRSVNWQVQGLLCKSAIGNHQHPLWSCNCNHFHFPGVILCTNAYQYNCSILIHLFLLYCIWLFRIDAVFFILVALQCIRQFITVRHSSSRCTKVHHSWAPPQCTQTGNSTAFKAGLSTVENFRSHLLHFLSETFSKRTLLHWNSDWAWRQNFVFWASLKSPMSSYLGMWR